MDRCAATPLVGRSFIPLGYPSPDDHKPGRCYPRAMVATSHAVGAGASPYPERRRHRLASAWPLIVLFPMLPLWWVLGVSGLVLSLCLLPLAAAIILRRRL